MTKMIFVNLPVQHLNNAIGFYQALGFSHNPQFSDDSAACMVWSEHIYVMLLTLPRWQSFTKRPLPAPGSNAVMLALSMPDKQAVDQMVSTASAQGGIADVNPMQDLGFMYGRSLTDLDGHIWETFWMDPASANAGCQNDACQTSADHNL